MADQIVVLREGNVVQMGTPEKALQVRVWVSFPVERCLVLDEDRTPAETTRLPYRAV
jgi:ABC-type Fe3+/spermidine/putrescine transport system ATPase subunit